MCLLLLGYHAASSSTFVVVHQLHPRHSRRSLLHHRASSQQHRFYGSFGPGLNIFGFGEMASVVVALISTIAGFFRGPSKRNESST